jgi:phosphoribosylamine---glycine ligase
VVAARGYPGTPAKGGVISGLEAAETTGAIILHAGTAVTPDGRLISTGGRVLGVTATGQTVCDAVSTAYAAIEKISFADGFHRADIGWREIARERASG